MRLGCNSESVSNARNFCNLPACPYGLLRTYILLLYSRDAPLGVRRIVLSGCCMAFAVSSALSVLPSRFTRGLSLSERAMTFGLNYLEMTYLLL